jgi:hypothetical protein
MAHFHWFTLFGGMVTKTICEIENRNVAVRVVQLKRSSNSLVCPDSISDLQAMNCEFSSSVTEN